ncbi:MAG: hypothetical protein RLZZ383_2999 [Pseudomonadota bacterium]|jgi:hypothetical protein
MRAFAVLLPLSAALAATALADDAPDASQTRSFRKLVYGRDVVSTLEPEDYAAFRAGFDWFGMDERTGGSWDPLQAGKNVQAWCEAATRDMQEQLGRTDERDEAQMTLDAAQTRCAQAYDYSLDVRIGQLTDEGQFIQGGCKGVSTKDGTPGYECAVQAYVRIRHFDVAFENVKGNVRGSWSVDQAWLASDRVKGAFAREPGEISFRVVNTGTAFINRYRGPDETRDVAEREAANSAGRFLYRKVLNIEEFRQGAPLQYVRGGRAGVCLGGDQVYKDMPFVVYSETTDGQKKRKGFIKVRKIADGCEMTTELREREQAGETIDLGPSTTQIVLGRAKLQPAMKAERLPDMGLNVGLSLGLGSDSQFFGFSGHLVAEQNLARWTGVSELHAVLRAGAVLAGSTLVTADLGIRKRGYLGPLFLEAGAFFSYANDVNYGINYYGGRGEVGIGGQISPRVLLHVPLSFIGQASDYGTPRLAPEAEIELLYTF